ncbi:MAG: DUF3696 domain-containing protein [Deltaproteobacteria bacterium]|jgi:predicted ATPase|nr:DUF3696 domain-containing protein [Deltaproteobacteria bacterium]
MLHSWTVSNFKSIREKTELTLGPLTFLCGENNSGKSSFIQSLLLISQTLSNEIQNNHLILNGNLVNLGQFKVIISNDSDSDHILIQFSCALPDNANILVNRMVTNSKEISDTKIYYERSQEQLWSQEQLQYISGEIIISSELEPELEPEPTSFYDDSPKISPNILSTKLSRSFKDSDIDKAHFLFRQPKPSPNKAVQERNILEYEKSLIFFRCFFTSYLKYLGPFREAPKLVYQSNASGNPYDIGVKGEYTCSIFELHKNKLIRYIPPKHFLDNEINLNTVENPLEFAVSEWLQYLGVANSVESHDLGEYGVELKVRTLDSSGPHSLTNVGVGVSQVLPVLVMCLLAPEESLLIFEQPELRLNPKVQSLLGDFFLSIVLTAKQCIIETHSEYLIDRVRFRISASATESKLSNLTKIYFVEKLSNGSSFKNVVINEYGAVKNWPRGFFEESQILAERILRAATIKRKSKDKDKNW